MEPGMLVSEQEFLQLALDDYKSRWELHCGRLRRKPDMSFEHNYLMVELQLTLALQLDREQFQVRTNLGHVRRSSESYYIPDVFVLPKELVLPHRGERQLENYSEPLPLVVEFWSPSTGDYDVKSKLQEYQRRGDLEIWLIHTYDRVLRAWRRQPDGSYAESTHTHEVMWPVALPGVSVDLDALFA
jgi:Uma2 family endonuclease